jgi:hypothetical protein
MSQLVPVVAPLSRADIERHATIIIRRFAPQLLNIRFCATMSA